MPAMAWHLVLGQEFLKFPNRPRPCNVANDALKYDFLQLQTQWLVQPLSPGRASAVACRRVARQAAPAGLKALGSPLAATTYPLSPPIVTLWPAPAI